MLLYTLGRRKCFENVLQVWGMGQVEVDLE